MARILQTLVIQDEVSQVNLFGFGGQAHTGSINSIDASGGNVSGSSHQHHNFEMEHVVLRRWANVSQGKFHMYE